MTAERQDDWLERARRGDTHALECLLEPHRPLLYALARRFGGSVLTSQELVQAGTEGELSYRLIEESGPDHQKKYVVEACIGEKPMGQGEGGTKKQAEQEAAYQALLSISQNAK